ncbi:hypothetical protein ATCC90586_008553 [Pythium insidiosum]|nr:hypothetical protein ATCC90586_008553 [Pythium insidiosum]
MMPNGSAHAAAIAAINRCASAWPVDARPRRLSTSEAVRLSESSAQSCSSRWLSSVILLPFAPALRRGSPPTGPAALRAFVDLVAQLSATPRLQWRDQDASFWQTALWSSCFEDQRVLWRYLLPLAETARHDSERPSFIVDLVHSRPAPDYLERFLEFLTAPTADVDPNLQQAVGGLRRLPTRSEVDIDFTIGESRRIEELRYVLEAFAAYDDSSSRVQLVVSGLSISHEQLELSSNEWSHLEAILAIDSPRAAAKHVK